MNEIEQRPAHFMVEDWEVDPSTNRLTRRDEIVKLEPKVMAVLVYLAGRAGQTVSRADLEAAVWTGTVVGYDAVTGAVQKLRRILGDESVHPRFIETLSKKGYRLIAPVSVPEDTSLPCKETPGQKQGAVPKRLTRTLPAVLILAAVGVFLWFSGRDPPVSMDANTLEPKTVAILPFRNLTGDSTEDYFAEGMSDDLIASLARFSNLRVIARDSSSLYTPESLDAREIADQLNARYLLRGSVRRTADHLRISVLLTDAQGGDTLWAENFDAHPDQLFELQDRITHRTVAALAGRVNVLDRQELGHPHTKNLQAYDYFLYGRQRFFQYAGADENRNARDSFGRAIALDPQFAMAYAMLGWTHAFDAMNGWTESRRLSLEHARELASQAISIDHSLPVAYFVRGLAYRELGDRVHALVDAQKAIELDPNYASAHVLLATLLYFNGRAQEGLDLMKRAIALNPNHPFNYSFHLGQAYYILGRYEEAIAAFNKVLETNPAAERAHLWLAAAFAQANRDEDAEWEVEQVRATNAELSLDRIRHWYPFTNPSDLDHLVTGLRKAGLKD